MKPILRCDLDGVLVASSEAIARVHRTWRGRRSLPQPRVCITADQLTRGTPDPEGYARAAAALGAAPAACVVLEDAPAGVAAGLAAGMHAIAVLTSHARAELAGAHAFVDDLHDVPAIAARLVADGRYPRAP